MSEEKNLLEVSHLKQYFPVHQGFKTIPLKAVDDISFAHCSVAYLHLVRNGHPVGIFRGLGTSPSNTIRLLCLAVSGSGIGTADSKLNVYGCIGLPFNSSASAISIIFPRYITAIR